MTLSIKANEWNLKKKLQNIIFELSQNWQNCNKSGSQAYLAWLQIRYWN